MTIINPNSIAGITSVTAEAGVMNFYKSDGTLAGLQLNGVNFNTTSGISTFNNVYVGGTITYEDVKNVDSIGIVTARAGVNITGGNINLGDSANTSNHRIFMGADNDMFMYHNGTHGVIENTTGNLHIKDDSIKLQNSNATTRLEVTTSGVDVTGILNVSSYVSLDDSVWLYCGTSNDLAVGHDGSNARIVNTVGNIRLEAKTNELGINIVPDGAVELYYNNAQKLATTNTGVSITGIPVATQTTGNVGLELHATGSGRGSQTKYHNDHGVQYVGTAGDTTGNLLIWQESNANIFFATNNTERLRIDSSGRLLVGTSTPAGNGIHVLYSTVNSAVEFQNNTTGTGGGQGLYVGNSTSNIGYLWNYANDALVFATNNTEKLRITSDGKMGLGVNAPVVKAVISDGFSAPSGGFDSNIVLAITKNNSSGNHAGIALNGAADGGTFIHFGDTADSNIGRIYYDSSDNMIFYTNNTDRLRIKSGGEVRIGANSTTASTAGDDLVIEGSSDRGISIISGSGSSANIYFGDSSDADIGRIAYQHNDNALDFSVNAAGTVVRMQSDGNLRWYPDGSSGVNMYLHSNGASAITYAVYKNGSVATTCAFKNQNSSGQAQTWMEVNGSQQVSIPYGMGGTDPLNIYVGTSVTKGINIMGQDGANQNSDSGRIHFNGYAQTNGPWIWGENVLAYGKKDLVFGTHSTTNDYTTEVGETMRMLYYGSMQGGISPDATLWDSGNQMGWHYNRSAGSFQQATNASTGYASWYINKNTGQGGSTDRRYIDFYMNNNQVGRIQENGSGATSYGTSSDYRRKENLAPITDGITEVKKLKPYRFNFKTCDSAKINQGFLAHEAQEIVPHAVSGTKDGMKNDERGDNVPDYQDIDYGQLTPLLTAALQEAIAEIETLKTEVAALKSS